MDDTAHPLHAVRREQLASIQGRSGSALLIGLALALLLAHYLGATVPPALTWGWLGAKAVITAVRALAMRRLPGGARPTLALMALDGLLWGVAGAWLSGHADPAVVAWAVGALVSISCIATFGLQVYPLATAAYVVPVLLPVIAAMAARLDRTGLTAALGLALVLALQLLTARQAEARLTETVRLRREAEALAQEKDEALALALQQSAAKSEFLGRISHELRTPLHGMLGLARLVQAETPPGRARRWLDLIDASGRHLLALINDLLDAERGRVDLLSSLRSTAFDVSALVQQVVGLHQQRAREKGLVLAQHVQLPPSYWVLGDERRFTQVLHNLLGNAIKFTPQGRVLLSVRLPGEPGLLRVDVSDTGPGIAPAEQARIFEAFARAHAAHGSEGTGLGLTISRDVARAMGGELSVHSVPGQGACFTFQARLPTTCAPPPPPAVPASAPVPSAAAALVLVAEDDEVNALITAATLDQMGLRHERVADGAQAVRRMQRGDAERPQLVLMDCRMPQLDGHEATRQIRAHEYAEEWPRTPIVALTATATEDSRVQCIQAGMDDFLAKPYTPNELMTVVRAWMTLVQPG